MCHSVWDNALSEILFFLTDALLADLQNTVPGGHHTLPSSASSNHHVNNSSSSVPGYGSLNGVRGKQSPLSVSYFL